MVRWRRRRNRSGAQYPTSTARQRAEIVGVTIDPRHDLASGGTGLYEFWTDHSVPVRLHDTELISVELRPIDRTMILQFEYTQAQWTPPEAVPTPVVVMRFEEVAIHEWEQQGARNGGDEPPAEAHGQVDDFEYDNWETFRLATYSSIIEFIASRLTITLEPRR